MRILSLAVLTALTGCGTVKYVPVEKVVEVKDTVIVKVDTVRVEVPVERVVEVVPEMDTLKMETSVARAEAWMDGKSLRGRMENKRAELKKPVDKVERLKYVTVRQEVPVEVVKEKRVTPEWAWGSLIVNLAVVGFIVLKLRRL